MRLHPKQLLLTAFLVFPLAMVTTLVVSIVNWLEDGPLMHADAVGARAGQAEGTTAMRQWLESEDAPSRQPQHTEPEPDPNSLSGGSRLFQPARPSPPELAAPTEPAESPPIAFEVRVRDRSGTADQGRPLVLLLTDAEGAELTRPMSLIDEGDWSLVIEFAALQERFGREMRWPLRARFAIEDSPLVEADRRGAPVEPRTLRTRDLSHGEEGQPPTFEFTIEGFAEPEDPASG